MSEELFPAAAPDFSDPLGLLKACHGRIKAHCDTLKRLVPHLREKGLDSEARQAVGRVLRYFGTAAQHHHEDEEKDLFPRLARQSLKLADIVHRLRREHETMAANWERMKAYLQRPDTITADLDAFGAFVDQFCAVYDGHIEVEDEALFEMARHILSQAELKKLGQAMAERRGQRFG